MSGMTCPRLPGGFPGKLSGRKVPGPSRALQIPFGSIGLAAAILLMCEGLSQVAKRRLGADGGRVWVLAPDRVRVEPDAGRWRVGFVLLSTGRGGPARLRSVKVDGTDVSGAVASFPDLPINRVKGVSEREMDRWLELWRQSGRESLAPAEEQEFDALLEKMRYGLDRARGSEIALSAAGLPFAVTRWADYRVTVEIGLGSALLTFDVIMAIRTLPSDPDWSPADLHIHTRYSDGSKTPAELKGQAKDMGYRIVYVTDHSDQILASAGSWRKYAEAISSQSDSCVALYPGAEVTVGRWYGRDFRVEGDILAYGTSSLQGLDNRKHPAQTAIDNVLGNNPGGPSSPGVAHPTRYPQWTCREAVGFRGWEIMSGIQANFSDTAFPMVRWRSELSRLLGVTFTDGQFPGVRTGSDWHGSTAFSAFVTWIRTGDWGSKSAVDGALYHGRTVASRRGGLAYMSFTCRHLTAQVGDVLRGVPAGASVGVSVTLKPVEAGTYTVEVWEDDRARCVFTWAGACRAGKPYSLFGSFIFPGDRHYYYLYVHGPDHIYSSPIFLGTDPAAAPTASRPANSLPWRRRWTWCSPTRRAPLRAALGRAWPTRRALRPAVSAVVRAEEYAASALTAFEVPPGIPHRAGHTMGICGGSTVGPGNASGESWAAVQQVAGPPSARTQALSRANSSCS